MKYCIIIIDGAADQPIPEFDGRTPLEKAACPQLDELAARGEVGTVQTVPEGYPPGSDVAIMSLLGNDPAKYYSGRAPIEAAARNIPVAPGEWVFRCNLVTLDDGRILDHSAGNISSSEAEELIRDLDTRLGNASCRFYPGVSYRNLLVCGDKFAVHTTPPHDILDKDVSSYYPTGTGAGLLMQLINSSREILADHPVNRLRMAGGLSPANSIWLWGEGTLPVFDSFEARFGVRGAVISAVDLVHGLGKLMGWKLLYVEGATGYLDTNYQGKGAAAIKALQDYDLVCVHIEAPDEAGHGGNPAEKVAALEKIDQYITGPLFRSLLSREKEWRILVMPDHPTPCAIRTHTRDAVPYVISGTGIKPNRAPAFSEALARETGLFVPRGHRLIERLLAPLPG